MNGEFLDIDTVTKMTQYEKELEKTKRAKDLVDKLLSASQKENIEMKKKNRANLETIEAYVKMKINEYKEDKNTNKLINSLIELVNAISVEKDKFSTKSKTKYEKVEVKN